MGGRVDGLLPRPLPRNGQPPKRHLRPWRSRVSKEEEREEEGRGGERSKENISGDEC